MQNPPQNPRDLLNYNGGDGGNGNDGGNGGGGDIPQWVVNLFAAVLERYLVNQLARLFEFIVGASVFLLGAGGVAWLLATGRARDLMDALLARMFRPQQQTDGRTNRRRGGPVIVELPELEDDEDQAHQLVPARRTPARRRALPQPASCSTQAAKNGKKKPRDDGDDSDDGPSPSTRTPRKTPKRKGQFKGLYSNMC